MPLIQTRIYLCQHKFCTLNFHITRYSLRPKLCFPSRYRQHRSVEPLTCMHIDTHTLTQDAPVSCRNWRNGEGSSFRGELFMLMLLNYLCYLCYCDVWLSLKEVYFGLSWQPVKAQEVRPYLCAWECVSLYLPVCVCVYVMARVANSPDVVAMLCWHWGWASGNHTGRHHLCNWTVARGDSWGTPLSVQDDRVSPQDRQPGEIRCVCVCVCLWTFCISKDLII